MLLILANPDDETARLIASEAQARGVGCLLAHGFDELAVSIESDRSGHTAAQICLRHDGTPIKAVLNRGLPNANVPALDQFRALELLATWWSLLARFPGPVINRPSASGFIPTLDPLTLARVNGAMTSAPMYLGTGRPPTLQADRINVHALPDRRFLGHISNNHPCDLQEDEAHIFTGFNPHAMQHIMFVGRRIIDLSGAANSEELEQREPFKSLAREISSRGAMFSIVILERSESRYRIAYASPLPTLAHYRHVMATVHGALFAFLLSASRSLAR
jgi:hypothetical protein